MNIRDFSEEKKEEESAKELYEKYKNSSGGEIMSELLRRVAISKSEGTFDKERLRATLGAISSSLSEEQKEKLNDMLDKL